VARQALVDYRTLSGDQSRYRRRVAMAERIGRLRCAPGRSRRVWRHARPRRRWSEALGCAHRRAGVLGADAPVHARRMIGASQQVAELVEDCGFCFVRQLR
jgi:hypothetical protein